MSNDRISGLKQLSILTNLSDAALEEFARNSTWREYEKDALILGYQDTSTDVSFLLAGKVRAIIYSPEGTAVVFADLKPGAMFGEIAAVDRKPRSASVEALESCTIVSLSADRFEQLMLRESSVAVAVLRHVASEVRRLSERVLEFSTLAVRNRIHAELLRLAGELDPPRSEAILSPAPSLSDIASRISTHREAVSRELSRLTGMGLIRRQGGDLLITDIPKLLEFVNDAKGE